jgi:hypothetical protein
MRTTLTPALALALSFTAGAALAETPDAPLEEIVVTGEFAGPGMWQVTHPDHPGHTLWIVGEPPPLPNTMRWRSEKVERVASQSQEILMQTGVSLKPAEKIGVFRMMTLVPAALKLRKNPDKATLRDLLPPELYARWLVQKKRFLGRDAGLEKWRPFLVAEKLSEAAYKSLQLGRGGASITIWPIVQQKKIPVTHPTLEFTFETEGLRDRLKALAREKLADEDCLAKTIELTEALSDKQLEEARARAWATGDLDRLQELPPLPKADVSCEKAILDSLSMTTTVPADLPRQMDEKWLAAAANAVAKNESTLAFVKLDDLLGERGYLEKLRERGYGIAAPDGAR